MDNVNTWNWTRRWLPRSEIGQSSADAHWPLASVSDDFTLEELADRRLLVLLGEPGSGKSVELRQESSRLRKTGGDSTWVIFLDGRTTIHDSVTLMRYWFDSDDWMDWQDSDEGMWLFFDGFDESSKLIPNLVGIISTELNRLKVKQPGCLSRLHFRFGSRSTGWSEAFGVWLAEFVEIRGPKIGEKEKDEFLYSIAPPTRKDIEQAANIENVDGTAFLRQIDERRVEPLAMRPAQLKWLIAIFREGGVLPTSKGELYWEGIRQHALPEGQQDESKLIRAIAGRVAFVSLFSGHSSLWTAPDRGDVADGALPLACLAGGTEETDEGQREINTDHLYRAVQSGLFSQVGHNQAVWFHQTFPEFLAARYCVNLNLPLSQILGLITNPNDADGKVLPGMKEVAAWMASMSSELLEHLLLLDPETLIASDVAMTTSAERRRLVRAYFIALQEDRALQIRWPGKSNFKQLYFDGIDSELEIYIHDKSLSKDTRDTAIVIAESCSLSSLAPALASVALDSDEPEVIRRSAAYAVTRLGNVEAHRSLLPLLHLSDEEDPFEELRGCALSANWPASLSIEEVLSVLAPPRWEGIGAYRRFLIHGFVEKLHADQLLPVLEWFSRQPCWDNDRYDRDHLESQLMDRALLCLGASGVFEWLVLRVAENLANYRNLLGGGFDRPSENLAAFDDTKVRRALCIGLSQSTGDVSRLSTIVFSLGEIYQRNPGWVGQDFTWWADRLGGSESGSGTEEFWFRLVKLFALWNTDHLELVYRLYCEERFASNFAYLFDPVDWRSEKADELRKICSKPKDLQEESQDLHVIDREIQAILKTIEADSPYQWWRIDHRLQFDANHRQQVGYWDVDIMAFPSWSLCATETHDRIVASALPFLVELAPRNDCIGTNSHYWDNDAAFRALVLLNTQRPESLSDIAEANWIKLGPVILGIHPGGQPEVIPHQHELLEIAMFHGFDPIPWLETMAGRAKNGSSYFLSSALDAALRILVESGDAESLERLAARLINPVKSFDAMLEATRQFFKHGYEQTFPMALAVAEELSLEEARQGDAARLISTLMQNIELGQWDRLKPLALCRDDLFKEIFLEFSYRDDRDSRFERMLYEHEVSELYTLLVREFPPSEDVVVFEVHTVTHRESLGQWRDGLLSRLAMRGTWEAVSELRMLAEKFPEFDWMRWRVAEAENAARQATWQPATAEALMDMVRRPTSRTVSSAGQLQEVILESLAKLQKDLQAPTPAAESWWNYPHDKSFAVPKQEEECSNEIQRHFERDLSDRMVLTNREVKSRKRNIKDLLVEVMVRNDSGGADRISVVCEVKGCWNKDLMTSQQNQLLKQYMQQEGYTHGIYIVAFFDGDRWEKQNRKSRHSKNRRHTLESLISELSKQAEELSAADKTIKAVVLDLNFESGPVSG